MKLGIIVGTTRTGRVSDRVAKWVAQEAQGVQDVEVEVLDLKDYPMPFFDEPASPRYNPNRQPAPEVQQFLSKVASFDAYVYVTAEYNHSVSGVLKNAIDYLTYEMTHKPAGIVSHGSVGGARAAEQLKLILLEAQAAVIPHATTVSFAGNVIDEEGNLNEEQKANPYGPASSVKTLLTDLKWYSDALAAARNA